MWNAVCVTPRARASTHAHTRSQFHIGKVFYFYFRFVVMLVRDINEERDRTLLINNYQFK